MTENNWERVITEAAGLGAGQVTFIGGEPTLYPDLPRLVRAALGLGLGVEVYSNLVRVTAAPARHQVRGRNMVHGVQGVQVGGERFACRSGPAAETVHHAALSE